jgi:heat shock protein HtpX
MTLYTNKEQNIRRTWLLFTSFFGLVIGLGWVISNVYNSPGILYIAVLFSIISSLISYWSSDSIALALSRAQAVKEEDYPDLYNLVENLSITAGLPMPRVYVTPETQINAFATGRDPKHAAIAVTKGALARLDRSELEGVLAHELSHVGNRDILVSTVAVVLAGVISIVSDIFLRSMFWGGDRRRGDDKEGGNIFALLGIVFALLAPLGAMLMQLAISRRREYLADSSGVLLTRYPDGLISALRKIQQDAVPMAAARDATAHLWLDNPFKKEQKTSWFHKLFMTHPPIEDRIRALEGRGSV